MEDKENFFDDVINDLLFCYDCICIYKIVIVNFISIQALLVLDRPTLSIRSNSLIRNSSPKLVYLSTSSSTIYFAS